MQKRLPGHPAISLGLPFSSWGGRDVQTPPTGSIEPPQFS
jgi:hypothetical protein